MDTISNKEPASPWAEGAEHEARTGAGEDAKPRFAPGTGQAIVLDMVQELEATAKALRAIVDTSAELADEGASTVPATTDEKVVMLLGGLITKTHHDAMNGHARRMLQRVEELDPEGVRKARESTGRPRSPFDGL